MNAMKHRNGRGFTLIEAIIVVAVLAILIGVAVPSVMSFRRSSDAKEREERAKAVFFAAQNALTDLQTNGVYEEWLGDNDVKNRENAVKAGASYEDWNREVAGLGVSLPGTVGEHMRVLRFDGRGNAPLSEAVRRLLEGYLPSVDAYFANSAIAVEFNTATGIVGSAFYVPDYTEDGVLDYNGTGRRDLSDRTKEGLQAKRQGYFGVNSTGKLLEQASKTGAGVLLRESTADDTRLGTNPKGMALLAEIRIPKEDESTYNGVILQKKQDADGKTVFEETAHRITLSNKAAPGGDLAVLLSRQDKTTPPVMKVGEEDGAVVYWWVLDIYDADYTNAANMSASVNYRFPDLAPGYIRVSLVGSAGEIQSNMFHSHYGAEEVSSDGKQKVYYVANARHLNNVRGDLDGIFFQTNNIDAGVDRNGKQITLAPLSSVLDGGITPKQSTFRGMYSAATGALSWTAEEGTAYRIRNLSIDSGSGAQMTGMFGMITGSEDAPAKIQHLVLDNVEIKGARAQNFGSAAGYLSNGEITHVVVGRFREPADDKDSTLAPMQTQHTIAVSAQGADVTAGGIVGKADNGAVIEQCSVLSGVEVVTDSGAAYAGGIAGSLEYGGTGIGPVIRQCNAGVFAPEGQGETLHIDNPTKISVLGANTGENTAAGGIAGRMTFGAQIEGCTNIASISSGTAAAVLGGIVGSVQSVDGEENSVIRYCVNAGALKAAAAAYDNLYAGGIGGSIAGKALVESSYHTGRIFVERAAVEDGGVVKMSEGGAAQNPKGQSFTVAGQSAVGGIAGVTQGDGITIQNVYSGGFTARVPLTGAPNEQIHNVGALIGWAKTDVTLSNSAHIKQGGLWAVGRSNGTSEEFPTVYAYTAQELETINGTAAVNAGAGAFADGETQWFGYGYPVLDVTNGPLLPQYLAGENGSVAHFSAFDRLTDEAFDFGLMYYELFGEDWMSNPESLGYMRQRVRVDEQEGEAGQAVISAESQMLEKHDVKAAGYAVVLGRSGQHKMQFSDGVSQVDAVIEFVSGAEDKAAGLPSFLSKPLFVKDCWMMMLDEDQLKKAFPDGGMLTLTYACSGKSFEQRFQPKFAPAVDEKGMWVQTSSDSYHVRSPQQLANISGQENTTFLLKRDVNGAVYQGVFVDENNEAKWGAVSSVQGFDGQSPSVIEECDNVTLEGSGYRITGLQLQGSSADNMGLFGMCEGGTLRNLTISAPQFVGSAQSAGAVAGVTTGAVTLENVVLEEIRLSLDNVPFAGGVVGYVNGGGLTVKGLTVSGLDVRANSDGEAAAGAVAGRVIGSLVAEPIAQGSGGTWSIFAGAGGGAAAYAGTYAGYGERDVTLEGGTHAPQALVAAAGAEIHTGYVYGNEASVDGNFDKTGVTVSNEDATASTYEMSDGSNGNLLLTSEDLTTQEEMLITDIKNSALDSTEEEEISSETMLT